LFGIVNFPRKFRNLRNAYAYAAFAEKPFVRKARCTKFAERLGETQKIWKQMLQTRSTAQVLAQLNTMAQEILWFWVRLEDGSLKKLPFSIRLLTWSCDCEGTDNEKLPQPPSHPPSIQTPNPHSETPAHTLSKATLWHPSLTRRKTYSESTSTT